ncbi:MAG: FeoA family protein [Spirochaetales bacterium]|nr:FeoA family protein [Spirochaetales bacterium]
MKLTEGEKNRTYVIESIEAHEKGMEEFLFTLGCFPGEDITLLSQVSDNYVVNVKDARYSIDESLASTIKIDVAEHLKKIV